MADTWNIRIGSQVIEASPDLARLLGYEAPYGDDETGTARLRDFYQPGTRLIAEALSEGLTGEAALLRAIAIGAQRAEAEHLERLRRDVADVYLRASVNERAGGAMGLRAAKIANG